MLYLSLAYGNSATIISASLNRLTFMVLCIMLACTWLPLSSTKSPFVVAFGSNFSFQLLLKYIAFTRYITASEGILSTIDGILPAVWSLTQLLIMFFESGLLKSSVCDLA